MNTSDRTPQSFKTRRSTWVINHRKIRAVYFDLLRKKNEVPTLKEVADITGFHVNTVRAHVNEKSFQDSIDDPNYGMITEDLLIDIASAAMNGSARDAKLFFKIVGDAGIDIGKIIVELFSKMREITD